MTPPTKKILFLSGALLFSVFGLLLSVLTGPVPTTLGGVWNALSGNAPDMKNILFGLRLPRALLAFFVGASLSLAGAILQGYFRNPMADPFVVGVSSGAALGAVLCMTLGWSVSFLGFSTESLTAFLFGLAIVLFVFLLSHRQGTFRVETLLLVGIAAGALASSLASFLLFLKSDSFEQAVFWLLGSFALADWRGVLAVAPYFIVALMAAQFLAKDMNLLVLGDDLARSLGSNTRLVRVVFLALATLLAAVSVSVSGIIGFVGLIVPHGVRIVTGPDHRSLFALSALSGGSFLLFADLLARTLLFPTEIPIGIITAAIGAPFFMVLLVRRKTV